MFPFFVHCSSFVPLPVWLAPSFVRLLFVLCSFFVRLLFVLCSSFVHLSVRLAPSFVRLYVAVVPPLEGVRGRLPLSFHYLLVRLAPCYDCLCDSHLPVRLALSAYPARIACATHTFNSSFFTKLLLHTYQNTSQRFLSRQS